MENNTVKIGRPRKILTEEEKEQRYLRSLERAKEYQARKRKEDPEHIKNIEAKYRETHKEKHRERLRTSQAKYRERKKSLIEKNVEI